MKTLTTLVVLAFVVEPLQATKTFTTSPKQNHQS